MKATVKRYQEDRVEAVAVIVEVVGASGQNVKAEQKANSVKKESSR